MSADVEVSSEYTLHAEGATRSLDELVHRVANLDESITGLGAVTQGVLHRMGGAIFEMATHGVGHLVESFTHLNDQYERYNLSIAGNLAAFQLVSGHEEGMRISADLLRQINAEAAALPGETEDFVETFRLGLPAALETGDQDLHRIAHTANMFTASMIAESIDAGQAASDFARILGGQVGQMTPSWRVLRVHIQAVAHEVASLHGHSVATAHDWRQLTQAQRWDVMQAALRRFGPMIDAFGDSWEAQRSTLASTVRTVERIGQEPMFNELKSTLREINQWLAANQQDIERFARVGGERLAHMFNRVRNEVIERAPGILDAARGNMSGTAALMAARIGFGPMGGLAAGSMMSAYEHHQEDVMGFVNSVMAGFHNLTAALQPVSRMLTSLYEVGGDFIASALPGLGSMVMNVTEGLGDFFRGIEGTWHELMSTLGPVASDLGHIFGQVAETLGGAFREAVTGLVSILNELIPVVGQIISSVAGAGHWLADRWQDLNERAGLGFLSRRELNRDVQEALGSTPESASGGHMAMPEADIDQLPAESAAHIVAFARHAAPVATPPRRPPPTQQQRAGHPGRVQVHIQIHNEINQANDPDRVLHDTHRALELALHSPIQTPYGHVMPLGGIGGRRN